VENRARAPSTTDVNPNLVALDISVG
jgi:hypothetical protein